MIIAIDFDGCLCRNAWPGIGKPRKHVIRRARRAQQKGATLILWTCREGERLQEALRWCETQGIAFDYANANTAENLAQFGGVDNRKIYADEYWDDKARRV